MPEKPFESGDAAPVDEQKPLEVADAEATQTFGPDSAIAVKATDLQDLVAHARKTGNEALAARFPMFQ